ncbi:hypothetical protein JYT82_00315 [bacterium AH-315-K20]|nr:hypothetical protein [bacterium AH-315-K20]
MSSMTEKAQTNTNGTKARWAGVGVTAAIAVLALTVQWGVVTTKLDQIESRITDLTGEIRSLRSDLYSIERRVSYLEGRLNGRTQSQSGGTP